MALRYTYVYSVPSNKREFVVFYDDATLAG